MIKSKFFFTFLLTIFILYISLLSKVAFDTRILISILVILYSILGIHKHSNSINFLHITIFYIFQLVWMGIAPLVSIALATSSLNRIFPEETQVLSSLCVLISIASFEFGLISFEFRQIKKASYSLPTWPIINSISIIFPIISFFLLVSTGQITSIFSSVSEFNENLFPNPETLALGAILNALIRIPIWLICLILICKSVESQGNKFVYFFSAISQLVINNPLIGTRFWMGVMYLSLILSYFITRQRFLWLRYFPLLCTFSIIAIYPSADYFRYSSDIRRQVWEPINPVQALGSSGNFDAFSQLSACIAFVHENGFQFGAQLLTDFLFFIPRSIWDGKSLDTGQILGRWQQLGNTNLSAPLQAELFIDGGFPLLVAGFFILGMCYKWVSIEVARDRNFIPVFVVISLFQMVILRGSLLQSMGSFFAISIILRLLVKRNLRE